MAISPDPDEWTDKAWKDRSFEDYRLKPYERQSLEQIRQNITNHAYTRKEDCEEHLELLEDLVNKIQGILTNERSIGKENWDVEQALHTIRTLHRELLSVHNSLSS